MIDRIIYQIFPDRFCNGDINNDPLNTKVWGSKVDSDSFMGGDIKGIVEKLDYIKELGISCIYLNPIFKSPSNHKYDTSDYFAIDPSFGNLYDFEILISECHKKDIFVIIDGVFNHTSTDFFAFKDVLLNQQQSKYKNWYDVFEYPVTIKENPQYKACGGAAFLPKLNTENKEVQDYIIKVIKYWEGKGIDGIRLDVPFEIHSSLLERIRKETNIYILGEIWGYGGDFVPRYFNGVTNYLLRELIRKAIVNQCITSSMFVEEWNTIEKLYGEYIYYSVNLAGSHDTERIYTLCNGNINKEKLFYTLLFLLPGIPLIYYGDEIGLEGENDPYCRGCMNWNEETWNKDIYYHVKELVLMRNTHKVLSNGKTNFICVTDRSLILRRYDSKSSVEAYINFGFQTENINGIQVPPMDCKFLFT